MRCHILSIDSTTLAASALRRLLKSMELLEFMESVELVELVELAAKCSRSARIAVVSLLLFLLPTATWKLNAVINCLRLRLKAATAKLNGVHIAYTQRIRNDLSRNLHNLTMWPTCGCISCHLRFHLRAIQLQKLTFWITFRTVFYFLILSTPIWK